MVTGGAALQYPITSQQQQQPAPSAPPPAPPQHKRTYQACIPCRKRKVRCDLGSVDNPHDPPCVRCRRESKECYFSATRRKRKPTDEGGSGDEDEFEIRNGRKRIRSRSESPGQIVYTKREERTVYPPMNPSAVPKAPLTPGGSIGRSQPLRRPQAESQGASTSVSPNPQYATRVPRQSQYGATVHTPSTSASAEGLDDEAHITNSTAAALIRTEVYNGHDALNLLFEAAGRTGDIGHRRIGSHGSSQPSPITGSKGLGSHERVSKDTKAGTSQTQSQPNIMGPPRSFPPGQPIDPAVNNGSALSDTTGDDSDLQTALKAWAKFRFIRAGWFTAREAVAYIDYFYTYLAPLSPIQPPNFQSPSTHATMLNEEPILTVTLLTVSSRYMKVPGPGGLSRSYAIHEKLWTYLRGMIERMIWGQEQFGGGLRAATMEDDNDMQTSSTAPWRGSRKGNLRTLGTVESLMLLTEWHPRALHFPPGDDGDELVVRDGPSQHAGFHINDDDTDSGSRGIGGKRLESYLEPAWRSDRMCWMLLGNAMALSFELGVFDDVDETSPNAGEQHRPEYGQESYRIRAKRVQKLLVIFVTQLAGRLEWNSNMVPQHISSSVFPKIPSPQQRHANVVKGDYASYEDGMMKAHGVFTLPKAIGATVFDNILYCWLGIANLMKRGNELIFRNKEHTRDIIRSGKYVELLAYFQPLLREWRETFNSLDVPKHLRHIISIEGEYVRMYINSLALQAVVDRLTNNANNDHLAPSTGSASPNSRSVSASMNPSTLVSLYGGDQEYVKEVVEASRSLLSIVVDGLLPHDYLKHCPIRTYFRIVSGAMFLLKTFALGAMEDEVAISLSLMDSTVQALRTCVVDDVHMGTRFADLLATLTSRIRARFVRMASTNSNNNGNTTNEASLNPPLPGPTTASGVPSLITRTNSRSPRPVQPIRRIPHNHPPQFPDPSLFVSQQQQQQSAWNGSALSSYEQPAYITNAAGRQTPNPLFGISTEAIDLAGGNISIMPPPGGFGFAYDVNGNGTGDSNGDNDSVYGPQTSSAAAAGSLNNQDAGGNGNGYVQDWLALPLDPLLQYGAGVSQTEVGPDVGGFDMLEILLANPEFGNGGGGNGGGGGAGEMGL